MSGLTNLVKIEAGKLSMCPHCCRISSLTNLIISRASLRGEVSAIDIQGLRELYLRNVSLNEAWIQKIATSLPELTHLSLGTCSVEVAGFWAEVMPANTLR